MNKFLFQNICSLVARKFSALLDAIPQNHKAEVRIQENILSEISGKISTTHFGKINGITQNLKPALLQHYSLTEYADYITFLEAIKNGSKNELWPGVPLFMAVTSGTTEAKKFIPVTKDSLKNQFAGPLLSLASTVKIFGKKRVLVSPPLTFGDAPLPEKFGKILAAPLSAMLAFHMPIWARNFSHPTFATRHINPFQARIPFIASEIKNQPPSLIVAMPPWLREFLNQIPGEILKKIIDVNPVLLLSGMNPLPYIDQFKNIFGYTPDFLETYPTSEGFFAWQDTTEEGLRLLLHNGIFFELLTDEYNMIAKSITSCDEHETGELIVTTNSGLFRYRSGDQIEIVNKSPTRIKILGRIKQTLTGFGEHLKINEADRAINLLSKKLSLQINEYLVVPGVLNNKSKAFHNWVIECDNNMLPTNFAEQLHETICSLNSCYKDLVTDEILTIPVINVVPKGTFISWMNYKGRTGLQQKLPRFSKDISVAEEILDISNSKI